MNEFDIIFSLGPWCRPAYYIQLCGLRKCAYPLDWQGCPLDSALHLYQTGFKDFFNEYADLSKPTEDLEGMRRVNDKINNIVSIHHIKDNIPLDKGVNEFKTLMLKRYKRLDKHLKNANSIMMLSNHNKRKKDLQNFVINFSEIYPNKKITLVNIHNRKNGKHKHIYKINDDLQIIEYFINDINKLGPDPKKNKNFWLGNEEKWIEIMKEYKTKIWSFFFRFFLIQEKNKNESV